MMLLCVTHELQTLDPSLGARYRDIQEWSVQKALSHVQVRKICEHFHPVFNQICLTSHAVVVN
ncbi:hypothetical protein DPMN_046913 [Dreissena polymorpha]|uniref:Uncharacterized protein n=1 Tax=Dreissena polymorpha TaxID=45954 RepID=A0A9D4I0Z8_DREPO|nr:hypothetical protein DPMN_046913 [Dreissena polymorpha]